MNEQYRTPEALMTLIRDIVMIWDQEDEGRDVSRHYRQSVLDRARLAIPGYKRPMMARLEALSHDATRCVWAAGCSNHVPFGVPFCEAHRAEILDAAPKRPS